MFRMTCAYWLRDFVVTVPRKEHAIQDEGILELDEPFDNNDGIDIQYQVTLELDSLHFHMSDLSNSDRMADTSLDDESTDSSSGTRGLVTIIYRGNGHTSGTVPVNQTVYTPGYVHLSAPGSMKKSGNVFVCWKTSAGDLLAAGARVDFPTSISGTITLDAYWIPSRVDIVYRGNGHTGGTVPLSQSLITPGSIKLQPQGSMVKKDHIFIGWRDSSGTIIAAGGTATFPDAIAGTAILDAYWIPSIVTIIYRGNGHTSGTVPGNQNIITPGDAYLAPQGTLFKSGFKFVGWRDSSGQVLKASAKIGFPSAVAGTSTLDAHWLPVVTMNHTTLLNSTASVSNVNAVLNNVRPVFMDTFAINLVQASISTTSSLNQKPGCTKVPPQNDLCDSSCGKASDSSDCSLFHHRSAFHFLNTNSSSGALSVFRFVDYRLCEYYLDSNNTPKHGEVGGLSWKGQKDMIVTTRSGNIERSTAHEISHLFDASDYSCTPNQLCVMTPGSSTYSEWCNKCREDIFRFRK